MFFENTRPLKVDVNGRNPSAPNNPTYCGADGAIKDATSSIGLMTWGSRGTMGGGCDVDTNTSLIWGDPNTSRVKGRKQLFERPFATTPFMGGGDLTAVQDESNLLFGHSTANRKSIQTVTDKPFPSLTPLIQEKQDDIQESGYFVEPFARGGISSRLIPKFRVQ